MIDIMAEPGCRENQRRQVSGQPARQVAKESPDNAKRAGRERAGHEQAQRMRVEQGGQTQRIGGQARQGTAPPRSEKSKPQQMQVIITSQAYIRASRE